MNIMNVNINNLYPKIITLTVFVILTLAAQAASNEHIIWEKQVLYVEDGDTLINLFGHDWYKVWSSNKIKVIHHGKAIESPDRILTGQQLILPPGAQLTDRAIERLHRYAQMRSDVQKALQVARQEQRQIDAFNPTAQTQPGYRLGSILIRWAESMITAPGEAGSNYLQARCLAEEATQAFRELQNQETYSETHMKQAASNTFRWRGILIGGFLILASILTLFGVFGLSRQHSQQPIVSATKEFHNLPDLTILVSLSDKRALAAIAGIHLLDTSTLRQAESQLKQIRQLLSQRRFGEMVEAVRRANQLYLRGIQKCYQQRLNSLTEPTEPLEFDEG